MTNIYFTLELPPLPTITTFHRLNNKPKITSSIQHSGAEKRSCWQPSKLHTVSKVSKSSAPDLLKKFGFIWGFSLPIKISRSTCVRMENWAACTTLTKTTVSSISSTTCHGFDAFARVLILTSKHLRRIIAYRAIQLSTLLGGLSTHASQASARRRYILAIRMKREDWRRMKSTASAWNFLYATPPWK